MAAAGPVAAPHRGLPPEDRIQAVSATQRADGPQSTLLLQLARQKPAGISVDGGKPSLTRDLQPQQASPPSAKRSWNLSIHRRDVTGKIAATSTAGTGTQTRAPGLQSALSGEKTSEYEVLSQLGAGNMGVVYHARQTSLNRELAIKTLKPDLAGLDHDQAMFVSEAMVTANLVHPNIIPIHDLGQTGDGQLFYSMKKVTGVSWNRTIRERTLEDNLDIFMKLCDAVAYAHSRGVINRDLKPENVVVGDYGEVIVLDWGLAITTEQFDESHSVIVEFRGGVGTPVYMAPELAEEDVSLVGPHSDIYLLGAILFEIVEGFPPHLLREFWHLEDPEEQLNGVIWAVINNRIEEHVVHDGELIQIARRSMSTSPADRYPSVEALQDAIREYRITGRAEELLRSVENSAAGGYSEFQAAVALYGEALRKWPTNRRAIEGDRRARLAYARLAHSKGDIDLGLQVLAGRTDDDFQPVVATLRKTRLMRRIVRGTWGVMSVTAVTLLFVATFFWLEAESARSEEATARQEAETANRDLISANGTITDLQKKEQELQRTAESLVSRANDAQKLLVAAEQAAADAKRESELAAVQAKTARAEADSAKKQALEQTELAALAEKQAEQANTEATAARQEAETALAEAEKQQTLAKAAEQAMYVAELQGFNTKIRAFNDLQDYDQVVAEVEDALRKQNVNPEIRRNAAVFEKQRAEALKRAGNSVIEIPEKPDLAAISGDARTVATYTRGTQPQLTVLQHTEPDGRLDQLTQETFLVPAGQVNHLAVSPDGTSIAVVGKEVKQLWQQQNQTWILHQLSDFFPASADRAGDKAFSKALFSTDGQYLFLLGADPRGTVEIYRLAEFPQLLLQQPLAGKASNGFRIRDAVLMPDNSALITQLAQQECYAFPLEWKDGVPSFTELSIRAPVLEGLKDDRLQAAADKPERLFLAPSGKLLALVFRNTVLLLPRSAEMSPELFPFTSPDRIESLQLFRCSFPVTDLAFSADLQRIVTGHDKRYIQVWDLQDGSYRPSSATGLYRHRADQNSSLRGHSDAIKCLGFLGSSSDDLVSVAANRYLRRWDISTYSDYVTEINQLVELLGDEAPATTDARRQGSPAPGDDAGRWQPAAVPARLRAGASILTSRPAPSSAAVQPATTVQPAPAANEPVKVRQGRGLFSARFSRDGSRIVVGANDLAAHVVDSTTGRQSSALESNTSGRLELFFNPERNSLLEGHISEIASVRFVPPHGDLLMTADYFGSISVWDAEPDEDGIGYEKSRLLSRYSFSEFAVSDDGSLVLAGGARSDSGASLSEAELEHFGILWRTDEIRQSPSPPHLRLLDGQHPKFAITATAFSPDATLAVTAGRRGRIVVWNVADGTVRASALDSHNHDQISGVFFDSPSTLITAGYDGRVVRWSISEDLLIPEDLTGTNTETVPDFIVRLRPSPDRRKFVTSDVSVDRSAVSADGTTVSAGTGGTLNFTVWSAEGRRPLLSSPVRIPAEDAGKSFRHDISWSTDGSELVSIVDGVITVYDAADLRPRQRFLQDQGGVRSVRGAMAPSSETHPPQIATFDGRFTHLWDLSSGTHLAEFRSHAPYSLSAGFSSDGRFVATGSDTVRVFDADESSAQHGRTLFRLPIGIQHHSPVASVAFSPAENDSRLASIDMHGGLTLWRWIPSEALPLVPFFTEPPSDAPLSDWTADLGSENRVAWNTDGHRLAVIRRGELRLLDLQADPPQAVSVPLPEGIECHFNHLGFSATGGLLAAGGVAHSPDTNELTSYAVVWKIADGGGVTLVGTIQAAGNHSVDVASDSGSRGITAIAVDQAAGEVLTGGADGRLLRWQLPLDDSTSGTTQLEFIADRQLRNDVRPHDDPLSCIDVAVDGRIVTSDEAGWFVIWPAAGR